MGHFDHGRAAQEDFPGRKQGGALHHGFDPGNLGKTADNGIRKGIDWLEHASIISRQNRAGNRADSELEEAGMADGVQYYKMLSDIRI